MEAILARLVDDLNAAVFTLLAILAVGFWFVYKLGGIVKTFDDFKEKNKELEINIGTIKDTLAIIKATTDLLYQSHIQTIQTKSPLALSPLGESYSKELNLEQKVESHWPSIKHELEKKSLSNPYDVQVAAMDMARRCFDVIFTLAEREQIKLFAYQKGTNLLQIFPIIGVLIRDKYLINQGIAIEEIDKHDPGKNK